MIFGNILENIMKETEWSNSLNEVSKYVIPLLDDNLTKDDLKLSTGFINAYTEDINRPWHNNNVFLLYKVENTYDAIKTTGKLFKLDTLKTWYPLKIDKQHYRMFVFQKCNSIYINKIIEKGLSFRSNEVLLSYCNFWNGQIDKNDLSKLLYVKLDNFKSIRYVTPEQDSE